jgi:hypothetical protein
MVFVPKGKTKNACGFVPLPELARQVIAMRLAELPDTAPDAPLWPELPVTSLTGGGGGKLSDRFRLARARLLPDAENVDFHSLRRSYTTLLEAGMNAGGRINPAVISTLMGQARGTLALDRYSAGASREVLCNAVADLETLGLRPQVRSALAKTVGQRPKMVRFAPDRGAQGILPDRAVVPRRIGRHGRERGAPGRRDETSSRMQIDTGQRRWKLPQIGCWRSDQAGKLMRRT